MAADDRPTTDEAFGARHGEAEVRDGERPFAGPPVGDDAALRFIGRIRSSWTARPGCPKNLWDARARGGGNGSVEIDSRYRPALDGLAAGDWIILLSWLHRARRDLALQRPRHAASPRGTFSLRSPVRPNPIGLHLVRIVTLDAETGRLSLDAIDVLDGTPLLDIKPFLPTVDVPAPPNGDP